MSKVLYKEINHTQQRYRLLTTINEKINETTLNSNETT